MAAMSTNSLCFMEARDAREKGGIELDEFVWQIVAHYGGLRHEADAEGQRPWFPSGFEDEVRKLVLSENYQALDDDNTAVVYSIFLSGFEGDVAAVRKLLEFSTIGSEYYLRPLMKIATLEGYPRLLRLCFENGFSPTTSLELHNLLYYRVLKNPTTEWLDVLFDLDYRQWRTDPQQLSDWDTWRYVFYMGTDCVRWWIEHGGRVSDAQGLYDPDDTRPQPWPGATTLRILLNQFGIDWFRDSGWLQVAVEKHDFETVKMLVEAGADVNEQVTNWRHDIREHDKTPLPALEEAVYARSEEMIRYLVKHGARVPHEFITDKYTPEEHKPFKSLVVELGAVKAEASL